MAGGVDINRRKPRRLRGTPALKYVNRLSFITVAVCSVMGIILMNGNGINRFNEKYFTDENYQKEQEEREARAQMFNTSMIKQKSSDEIKKILKHKEKYETEV